MTVQTFTVQVAQRGLITLPQPLRRAHKIETGQQMTLLDLDGVFVLGAGASQVDALAEGLRSELTERGATLESMLDALREVRAGRG
jgi:bifunctional DNA-binding transcriptional regulator/antitoxin component of YhaV-PrlF toxin-antitoxin module